VGPHIVTELKEICPYCGKAAREDVDADEHCALCGMAIAHPETAPTALDGRGRRLYYCCTWCLRLHVREAMSRRMTKNVPVTTNCPRPGEEWGPRGGEGC
jgi:hypothetical protein